MIIEVLKNSFYVYLAIVMGYVIERLKILPENASGTISTLALRVFGPFLIFSSLYGVSFESKNIYLVFFPILIAVILYFVAVLFAKLFGFNRKETGGLRLAMIAVSGGAVYPIVSANFPEYIFQQFVTTEISQFMSFLLIGPAVAVILANKYGKKSSLKVGQILKGIITDPFLLAMFFTILINLSGIQVPEFILKASGFFSDSVFVLLSFFMGMVLTLPSPKSLIKVVSIYIGRIGIVIGVVLALFSVLGLEKQNMLFLYLVFFAQFSPLSTIYAKEYELEHKLVNQLVVFSSLAQFVVYPVFIALWQ
jgi:hypothetical protein